MSSNIIKTLDSFGVPKGSEKIIAFLQLLDCIKDNYKHFLINSSSIVYIPTVNVKSEELENSKFLKLAKEGNIGVLARDDKYGKIFLELARVVIDQDYDRMEKYQKIISRRDEDHSKKYPNSPPYFGNYQLKTLLNCISHFWSGKGYAYIDYSLDENFPSYLYSKHNHTNIQILNFDTIMAMFMTYFRECIQIKFNIPYNIIDEYKHFDDNRNQLDNALEEKDVMDIITSGIVSAINTVIQVIIPSSS